MFYVFLLTLDDSCLKGPFTTRHDAQAYALCAASESIDATVWDQGKYDAIVREFGPMELNVWGTK